MTEQELVRQHPTSYRVLDFIRSYVAENGYAPTNRQIAEGIGLKAVSNANYHLMRLRSLGYITYETNKTRTIVLKGGER